MRKAFREDIATVWRIAERSVGESGEFMEDNPLDTFLYEYDALPEQGRSEQRVRELIASHWKPLVVQMDEEEQRDTRQTNLKLFKALRPFYAHVGLRDFQSLRKLLVDFPRETLRTDQKGILVSLAAVGDAGTTDEDLDAMLKRLRKEASPETVWGILEDSVSKGLATADGGGRGVECSMVPCTDNGPCDAAGCGPCVTTQLKRKTGEPYTVGHCSRRTGKSTVTLTSLMAAHEREKQLKGRARAFRDVGAPVMAEVLRKNGLTIAEAAGIYGKHGVVEKALIHLKELSRPPSSGDAERRDGIPKDKLKLLTNSLVGVPSLDMEKLENSLLALSVVRTPAGPVILLDYEPITAPGWQTKLTASATAEPKLINMKSGRKLTAREFLGMDLARPEIGDRHAIESLGSWLFRASGEKLRGVLNTYLAAREEAQLPDRERWGDQKKFCQGFRDHEMDEFISSFMNEAWKTSEKSTVRHFMDKVINLILFFQVVPISNAQVYCQYYEPARVELQKIKTGDPEYVKKCNVAWAKAGKDPAIRSFIRDIVDDLKKSKLPRTAIGQAIGEVAGAPAGSVYRFKVLSGLQSGSTAAHQTLSDRLPDLSLVLASYPGMGEYINKRISSRRVLLENRYADDILRTKASAKSFGGSIRPKPFVNPGTAYGEEWGPSDDRIGRGELSSTLVFNYECGQFDEHGFEEYYPDTWDRETWTVYAEEVDGKLNHYCLDLCWLLGRVKDQADRGEPLLNPYTNRPFSGAFMADLQKLNLDKLTTLCSEDDVDVAMDNVAQRPSTASVPSSDEYDALLEDAISFLETHPWFNLPASSKRHLPKYGSLCSPLEGTSVVAPPEPEVPAPTVAPVEEINAVPLPEVTTVVPLHPDAPPVPPVPRAPPEPASPENPAADTSQEPPKPASFAFLDRLHKGVSDKCGVCGRTSGTTCTMRDRKGVVEPKTYCYACLEHVDRP